MLIEISPQQVTVDVALVANSPYLSQEEEEALLLTYEFPEHRTTELIHLLHLHERSILRQDCFLSLKASALNT